MSLSVVYALFFYIATLVLIIGVGRKIVIYAKTPQPLKIPTTPAPLTYTGVVWRMFKEVTVFSALFRANKMIWLFGWMFHVGLLLVLLRHLRYFTEPVWVWVDLIQPFGKYAAFAMVIGLAGLWARRFLVDRIRYISNLSDHLMLALLLTIGISGLVMTFVSRINIVELKTFTLGLLYIDIQALPSSISLWVHLAGVITLMLIFPISKLLHAPGLFFSPTRNQRDNPREKRHVDGWTAK
ncbi:MAG: respiratory nitrate reductase subunit gamma [Thiohalomonadales bacterium]